MSLADAGFFPEAVTVAIAFAAAPLGYLGRPSGARPIDGRTGRLRTHVRRCLSADVRNRTFAV
jgi:hypothetical protein